MTKPNLKNLIEDGKYVYVNSNITTTNFPVPDTIQTENWKIIKMDKSFSSQEALDKIKLEGCRPANIYELAQWKIEHGDELKEYERCVAFGSLWKDADGNHRVPIVLRASVGVFEFFLGVFGCVWGGGGCLLCFCDSTLELKSSEKSDTLTLAIAEVKKAGYVIYKPI